MKGILLSGGMDSTTLAYLEQPDIAFNINYGQLPAKAEREASRKVCRELNIQLVEIDIDCSSLGSGDLAGKGKLDVGAESDWWPYRNQLLITLSATKALTLGCKELIIGTVASDSYHKDGSPEFIDRINALISFQEGGLIITAPGIKYSASDLIKIAKLPPHLLAMTHSCHKANLPCFECRGCNKHQNTLDDLGVL
ncbi:7-cyano-7-deazaguanine synthase [Neptunicella marina]|uniref:7-cyano-7-deazaguanine synthase n=1 Tax=Neptunicella marina TaxID=2125989 RepID=A0A8J6IRS4_9ALTE|nr:7-cyano-7-deazaguanine synthase [Neptunicella marina]MBC3766285.1 7-cyano-7-deazaguanine synthase [Neptunicella marina]MEE3028840.1 7-cyano-7-deazaguanine synthase [Pseudomonadota bacterium]